MRVFMRQLFSDKWWRILACTTLARGVAASGSLLLGVVLGRLYGAEGVGVFVLAQSFLFGAGILARFGLDNALMRFVAMERTSGFFYLSMAMKRALLLALPIALLVWITRGAVSGLFSKPDLGPVLAGVAIAIPAFTLTYILAGFMKGMHRPASACFLESGYVSLLTGAGVLLLTWSQGRQDIMDAGVALAVASWMVFIQGCLQLVWIRSTVAVRSASEATKCSGLLSERKGFLISARAFFVMSIAEFMQNVLSVTIAGIFLDSHDLGLFKSAERVALLIGFILMIVAAIFPPRFAALFQQQQHHALIRLARQAALLAAVMAAPLLLACLWMPDRLLLLFGSEFIAASPYLQIIAIAQTINVMTSTVAFLLNMTGHEALMRNIALCSATLGLLAFWIAIPWLGALGAALSLALVLVLQNLLALYFVRRRLGFWVYPAWR